MNFRMTLIKSRDGSHTGIDANDIARCLLSSILGILFSCCISRVLRIMLAHPIQHSDQKWVPYSSRGVAADR